MQTGRSIVSRPKTLDPTIYTLPLCIRLQQRRLITGNEKPLPQAEDPPGANQEQLPHVSEEAATTGKITGEGGPEIEQGTPVQEVCFLVDITIMILTESTGEGPEARRESPREGTKSASR